jgi:hypothetical protein
MVISVVNTWYIAPKTYNCVAQYLLAGVGRPERVQQRPLLHTSTNKVRTQYILSTY